MRTTQKTCRWGPGCFAVPSQQLSFSPSSAFFSFFSFPPRGVFRLTCFIHRASLSRYFLCFSPLVRPILLFRDSIAQRFVRFETVRRSSFLRRLFLAIRVVRYAGPQFRIVFNIHDFQSKSASSVVRCYFLSLVASMEIKRIAYRRVCILNLQIVIIVHRFVSLKLGATLIHHGHRNISSYQTPDSFIEVSYLIYLHFSIYGKIFQFKNCNVTQILMKR